MDREADLAARACIEIGMRGEEGVGFVSRGVGKAVDVVMSVAFGMGDADQRAERKILLHTEAGLAGQVLTADEIPVAIRAPRRRAGGIDDRFVDALARFRRDAAIAERPRPRERVIGIVGSSMMKLRPANFPSGDAFVTSRGIGCSI